MKTRVLRYSIGIDCAKDQHEASLGIMTADQEISLESLPSIPNTKKGFESLYRLFKKKDLPLDTIIVIEATGVYHESLAYYLTDKGLSVSIVVPSKAKYFSKTLTVKTVNDKVSSRTLATMGLEKKLDKWEKPKPVYQRLRSLTRERSLLLDRSTVIKNQLHAEEHSAFPSKSFVKRSGNELKVVQKHIQEVEEEIQQLLKNEKELNKKVKKVCTIKGIGWLTVVTVLGETNGFNLIRNKKQLVSYAGLDVVERTSGTSVRGRTRISKKGNKFIRKALYFPAFSAIRVGTEQTQIYTRLVDKHQIKMKGAVAVQRKLLELIYTLWKTNQEYDPQYAKKKLGQSKTALMELA